MTNTKNSEARPIPYPADTRAKGWRFELDYEKIEQSDTWSLAAEVPMAQHALLMMWMTAWTQAPCGSLPNDTEIIRAKCKIPPKMWGALMPVLMRGWWLAEDGRLYQDTIVDRVQEMLDCRAKERNRKASSRARQSGGSPKLSHGTNEGQIEESDGRDDTGTGTGTGTGIGKPTLVAKEDTEFQTHTARVSEPGKVCLAMKAEGIADVNPGHPDLLMLLDAGATVEEFRGGAVAAAKKQKGFSYALAVVKGTRQDAAKTAQTLHTGPLPAAGTTPQSMSFAERRRLANIVTYEEITGRNHPDRPKTTQHMGDVIDATPAFLEIAK